jgi:AraC family transcriptional regulator, ethanolamine operon transcriptional activator
LRLAKSASPEDEVLISRRSEQFVKLFLWELVDALEGSEIDVGPTRQSDIVNRATEFALSEQTGEIGLVEICAHLKVSLRKLHYAFQDVTGLPPATWLRRIRLNRVHKVLSRSSPDQILVKQVALANGFTHFGHFSRQYRSIFGCLPLQTLQAP